MCVKNNCPTVGTIRFFMKNKNKIILFTLLVLIAFSLSYKLKKYIIDRDYFVFMHAICKTGDRNCFSLNDTLYYKVYRKAYKVEACLKDGCNPFICEENEPDCITITCSENVLEDEEICNSIVE